MKHEIEPVMTIQTTAKARLSKAVRMLNIPQDFQFLQVLHEVQQSIAQKHAEIRQAMSACRSRSIDAAMAVHALSTNQEEETEQKHTPYLKRIEQGEHK